MRDYKIDFILSWALVCLGYLALVLAIYTNPLWLVLALLCGAALASERL